MATTIEYGIWTGSCRPDDSGKVFFQPWTVVSASSLWKGLVLTYNDSTELVYCHGTFDVPKNYTASTSNAFLIDWTSTATTGNRVWFADYRTVDFTSTEDFGSTTAQQSTSFTDAAPGTAEGGVRAVIAVSSGNFAASDVVQYRIGINGNNASDTHGARCHVGRMKFRCDVTT
jgi:hypothetical protein